MLGCRSSVSSQNTEAAAAGVSYSSTPMCSGAASSRLCLLPTSDLLLDNVRPTPEEHPRSTRPTSDLHLTGRCGSRGGN